MTAWEPKPFALRHIANKLVEAASAPYPPSLRAVLSRADGLAALAEIASWPGYSATALYDLPGLARALGIARLWYKDESSRFGLGTFKMLGGAYAVYRYLAEAVRARRGTSPSAAGLIAGAERDVTASLTVTAATSGNHGRSVSWGASLFGARAVIYIHSAVSESRKKALESLGAEVRRVAGNYDDSVRRCAADAQKEGWQVISDTSYANYVDIPRQVMQGYCVMADEVIRQLAGQPPPTHLFMQAGCGGFAAAVIAYLWECWGSARPRLIIVEPERADCVFRSIAAAAPVQVPGGLETIMGGLACGEVSIVAWEILRRAAADAIAIPDEAAKSAMRALAEGIAGDPPVVGGESGVGGLAGLLAACADSGLRGKLGLDAKSRVLIFGSEGDNDPRFYQEIVGRSAAKVRAAGGRAA